MSACCPSFWILLSIFIAYAVGEKVEIVDFSDLAIYDTFNDSYLKVFHHDYLYSGNLLIQLEKF
jgi:hypothetical protein